MMGLVPFWQPSTLCCCSQFPQLYCCIVEKKPFLSVTRKGVNWKGIATWGQPTSRQLFSDVFGQFAHAQLLFPSSWWKFWRRHSATTISLTIRRRFNSVTLTFDIWPWMFAVHRMSRDQTPYKFDRNLTIHGEVIDDIFVGVTSRCDLHLERLHSSVVTCSNSVQNMSEIEQSAAELLTT